MDRRAALKTALGGAAGWLSACEKSPVPSGEVATAGAAPSPGFTPKFLDTEQASVLEALVDALIPASDTPGARQAEVAEFVDGMLLDVLDEAEQKAFTAGLSRCTAELGAGLGRPFHQCSTQEQVALGAKLWAAFASGAVDPGDSAGAAPAAAPAGAPLLRGAAQGSAPPGSASAGGLHPELVAFAEQLRGLAITGFCNSRLGATRVLHYEAVPGDYRGCVPLEQIGRAWATR